MSESENAMKNINKGAESDCGMKWCYLIEGD